MRPGSLLVVGCLLLAGCVSSPPGAGDDEDGPDLSGYRLDCSIAAGAPSGWPEPCLAFASPNDSPSKTEVDLAVNPLDPDNVVVASKDLDPAASPCVWAVAQASMDGGASWTTSIIGGEASSRQPSSRLWGWNCITDPIMAYDASGTLHYSLQLYDHTLEGSSVPPALADVLPVGATFGSSIMAVSSKDGGLTWSEPIVLHAGDGPVVFHDYMRVAVNPSTQTYYTIWNQFTGVAVVPVLVALEKEAAAARSPVYIPVPEAAGDVIMSGLAIDTDGTVYVALNDGRDAWLTTSTDDAASFSAPVKFATHEPVPRMMKNNSYRSGSGFELALDTSGGERDGCLYATFADYVDEDADVNVMVSCDGGRAWSEPIQVNTGERARGDQWMERPIVDARGTLHLLYVDKSYDPENYGMDATWAMSRDGGSTWTLTRLTQHSFDPSLGIHQDGFPFIGDYNGIGASGDVLYMAFPTTITGRAEIAVAKVLLPEA